MNKEIMSRIKKVKALFLDVDGVLSDGKIVVDNNGIETKFFDVQDGFGIVLLRKYGFKTAIISARATSSVTHRANDLKIDIVRQDAYPKINAYKEILKELKLKDEHVCFMGDDLPDLGVLKKVGFAVAVANASGEVKDVAHYVTRKSGGNGAIREVIELILKAQGHWDTIVQEMS